MGFIGSRTRRTVLAAALLVGALGVAAPGPVDIAHAQGTVRVLPPRSVKHQNSQFWVWFAPRNWTSADSKQGITITSGNGLMTIDDGFSSIFCANGQTARQSINNYFSQRRRELRASLAANWVGATTNASTINQLPAAAYGRLYFRQTVAIAGVANGIPYRGVVQYDYSLATGPMYCFARSVAMTAPAQGFGTSISQLRSVHATAFYSGPGLPPGPNGEPA